MTISSLSNLDFYPGRGMYQPGEKVNLYFQGDSAATDVVEIEIDIFRGIEKIEQLKSRQTLPLGSFSLLFSFQPPLDAPAGYGAEIRIAGAPGRLAETAFDVLPGWTFFPRYGFVCDFSPARRNAQETAQTLAKYHLNGLQFYDWQYRHDSLVPPSDEFTDPLGRPLSLATILSLIKAAHDHGMSAMPYLAIYAASAAFWKAHPDWALYDADHQLIPFGEDFLGIMNPSAGTPWAQHLLMECGKALDALPFDGLHIDQYGEPKTGFDVSGMPVDLPKAFSDFITAAAERYPGMPVLFNAVGNWPIESLAKSPTAFNYIEIWPPETHYTDLVKIIRNARGLSDSKPVVIALYIPAERITNLRLADALIYSAGGTHIELGENGRLLSDPYFPKHEAVSEELRKLLRKQSDLVVRYEEWLSPLVEESGGLVTSVPEGVQAFARCTARGYSLSLVNLSSSQPLEWNCSHDTPQKLNDFIVEMEIPRKAFKVYCVSPDEDAIAPRALRFEQEGKFLRIYVPSLEIWDVLMIEPGMDESTTANRQ